MDRRTDGRTDGRKNYGWIASLRLQFAACTDKRKKKKSKWSQP